MFMAKRSQAENALPGAAARALRTLGENLRISRIRRDESLRARALRMSISVPTLRRMESGDASVSMGAYATALWLMQRESLLPELANPSVDDQALLLQLSRSARSK
jgi:transcriptional regulator with XRE-family HTH domain